MKKAAQERQRQRAHAIDDLLRLRAKQKSVSTRKLKIARVKTRKGSIIMLSDFSAYDG